MNYCQRYPPPDPTDPFAPLWVLRNKSAIEGSTQRPNAAGDLVLQTTICPADSRQHSQSGSSFGGAELLPRRVLLRSSSGAPTSPSYAVQLHEIRSHYRPHSQLSLSYTGALRSPSPGPFCLLPTSLSIGPSRDADTSSAPTTAPLVSAAVAPQSFEEPPIHSNAGGLDSRVAPFPVQYKHVPPSEQMDGKGKSRAKVAQSLLPIRMSWTASPSNKAQNGTPKDVTTLLDPGSSTSGPFQSLYPQRQCQQLVEGRYPSAGNHSRPTISPPIPSSLVWESHLTGRQFIPISFNPTYNTATPIRQTPQRSNSPNLEPLETKDDDSSRRGCLDVAGSNTDQIDRCDIRSRDPHNSTTCPVLSHMELGMQPPATREASEGLNPPVPTNSEHVMPYPPSPHHLRTSRGKRQTSFEMSSPTSACVEVSLPDSPLSATTLTPSTQPTPKSVNAQIYSDPILAIAPWTPHPEWSVPTSSHLAYAASLPIFRSDGTSIRFGSLFEGHRVIVIFLRHFFCRRSQHYAHSLSSLVRQLAVKENKIMCGSRNGDTGIKEGRDGESPACVELVLIGCGKPASADKYKEMFNLPFQMFTDPDGKLYESLGMGKSKKAGGQPLERFDNSILNKGVEPVLMERVELVSRDKNSRGEKIGLKMKGTAMVTIRSWRVGMPPWEYGGDTQQLGGEFILGPGLTCTYAHRMQPRQDHSPIADVLRAANVDTPVDCLMPNKTSASTQASAFFKDKNLTAREANSDPSSPPFPSSDVTQGTFVLHSLRSRGSAVFSRTNGSHESLGSPTAAGIDGTAKFPTDAVNRRHRGPPPQRPPRPDEDLWTEETRNTQTDHLSRKKSARGTGKVDFREPPVQTHRVTQIPSGELQHRRHKSGTASLSSVQEAISGNGGNMIHIPPVHPRTVTSNAPKMMKPNVKQPKSRSFSTSIRNFMLGD